MNLGEKLSMAARTDPGRKREQNEDRFFFDRPRGLIIVADGVGGHNAGEVASSMVTALLPELLNPKLDALANQESDSAALRAVLRSAIHQSNATLQQVAKSQPQYHGMGSALVLALFFDNRIFVCHVGDCRLYRLRQGGLQRLTKDHTLLQQLIDQGRDPEAARAAVNPHMLYQAMGVVEHVQPDIHDYPVEVGDLYLLCSDGLTDMVDDQGIQALLELELKSEDDRAERLVQAANEAGGKDNITIGLTRINAPFARKTGWMRKLFR